MKALTGLLVFALVKLLAGSRLDHHDGLMAKFTEWRQKYSKQTVSLHEEEEQFSRWERNYAFVQQHNEAKHTFTMELNQFADKDFKRHQEQFHTMQEAFSEETYPNRPTSKETYPNSFDWRTKGAVPPVIDQGQLGNAFVIAITEALESYAAINHGGLLSLSTQEIIDCCVPDRVFQPDVWSCIHTIGGVCWSQEYPSTGGSCRNNTCTAAVQIAGGSFVKKGDENDLIAALLKNPVAALVDASNMSFQLYRSGIYSSTDCGKSLDHAMLVVGYGTMQGKDYWICQNSWGTSWGMNGFMLLARNAHNMCGIASMASIPV